MNKSGKTYEPKVFLFCTIALVVSLALTQNRIRVIYLTFIFVHDSAEEAFFRKKKTSGDSIEPNVNVTVHSSDTKYWKNAIRLSAVCRLSGQRTIDKL